MFYKNYSYILIFLLFTNCSTSNLTNNKPILVLKNKYINKGFALVYDENLYNEKIISKKIDERSLIIFQKNLKKDTQVKITNILNNKSLIVKVGKKSVYPSFNNSVISIRIANELDIDTNEPYVEIMAIPENSLFIAKRAKTYEEEKNVANKVPVNTISINDLNELKTDSAKVVIRKFTYLIKIADFYFKDTALMLVERIKNETKIKEPQIKKISSKKHRVFLGPFDNIYSLQKSFNDINILEFENIEIIRND
tara:strand:+ start:258 stop:1016 length:759 start_codon:yes stop_codon:yes gene_type:complete